MKEKTRENGITSLTNTLVSLFLCKDPTITAGARGSHVDELVKAYSLNVADFDLAARQARDIVRKRTKENTAALKSVCF